MPLVTIARDPFARMDVVRETVAQHERGECSWCGQPARFRYGTANDGSRFVRSYVVGKLFCSVGCARSYGGVIPE